MMMTKTFSTTLVVLLSTAVAAQAAIDCGSNGVGTEGNITINGGQVNMAGATLFVDFFRTASSTNDWIDANGDGFFGFVNPDPTYRFVDQLATGFAPGQSLDTWWAFNYRSVGSVNGFSEFIDSQLCGTIPTDPPSEAGLFNRFEYAKDGEIYAGFYDYVNSSGTPLEQCEINGSFLDVPGSWAVVAQGGGPKWNRNPNELGYGLNVSESSSGHVSQLQYLTRDCTTQTLNFDTANPNTDTLFNEVAAWVPVTAIANRGTGLENVKFSEMQYNFATGRFPNGENYTAVTRDVGSGTHNAWMNSVNIDPSWGRGDNIGQKIKDKQTDLLGPKYQQSNKGGSSRVEGTVQNSRMGIGYTGLAGGSRSARDASRGFYEILNLCKDVDQNGAPLCDCEVTGYVRPSIDTVLDNCDACTGYQVAGSGTFVVRGNINANRDPSDPNFNTNGPAVANQAVADYLNNIFDSTAAFTGNVYGGECGTSLECSSNGLACVTDVDCGMAGGTCTTPRACTANNDCETGDYCGQVVNSPGQGLAVQFFLPNAIDCVHDIMAPLNYSPAASFNQALQDYTRANNGLGWNGDTPAFGSVNIAGGVPSRLVQGSGVVYSDGQANAYIYWDGSAYLTVTPALDISLRNLLAGDFNDDGSRDILDATELVNAYYAPRAWQTGSAAAGSGNVVDMGDMYADNAIPEVIGDFNGDGHFSKEDLRYFADGLAMVAGQLNRKMGAIAIDDAIAGMGKDFPWADTSGLLISPPAVAFDEPVFTAPTSIATFLATGATYASGDFRGDIAGATLAVQGRRPTAGAKPMGWDGRVDDKDIDYVCEQVVYDWSNIDDAVFMDLSADMDGDLDVDLDDVTELVTGILGTQPGDANLDGMVDAADLAIVDATIADTSTNGCNTNATCGWADGDFDCDKDVDADDRAVVNPMPTCANADVTCDGTADAGDILAIRGGANWNQSPPTNLRADVDGSGTADAGDILIIRGGANWNTSTGPCTCP